MLHWLRIHVIRCNECDSYYIQGTKAQQLLTLLMLNTRDVLISRFPYFKQLQSCVHFKTGKLPTLSGKAGFYFADARAKLPLLPRMETINPKLCRVHECSLSLKVIFAVSNILQNSLRKGQLIHCMFFWKSITVLLVIITHAIS